MAEIAPDRQKQNRQGIKPNSKEIWNPLTTMMEKGHIHGIMKENESMNRLALF